MAMAVPYDVRATNHAADDRAGRPGNDGAGACTDGDAFQRSGLSTNIPVLITERTAISLVKLD